MAKRLLILTEKLVLMVLAVITSLHTDWSFIALIMWAIVVFIFNSGTILNLCGVSNQLKRVERLLCNIGIGLASLMLLGLILNTIGSIINKPLLVQGWIVFSVAILTISLAFMQFTKQTRKSDDIQLKKFELKHLAQSYWTDVLLILSLPFLAIVGAVQLNNGGNPVVATLALVILVCSPFFYAFKAEKRESRYLVTIYATGLALLLSFSMRSNHILGSDIHQELRVFLNTLSAGHWSPHSSNSTYNACLSITILPTVMHALVPFSPEYIYKFVIQVLFAFVPLIIYTLAKNQLNGNKKMAYLAAIFFIAQLPFSAQFTGLIRQEVAFVFVGLFFLISTHKSLEKLQKFILMLIFGCSIVVAHYSTAYIFIALIIILLLSKFLFTRFVFSHNHPRPNFYLPLSVGVILFLFTFAWYGQALQSSGGIVQKLTYSVRNIDQLFSSDTHSTFVLTTFGVSTPQNSQENLEQAQQNEKRADALSASGFQNYKPTPRNSATPNLSSPIKSKIYTLYDTLLPTLVKALAAVGLLSMLWLAYRRKLERDSALLAVSAAILFVLLAILPDISQDYNLERLYQQLLIIIPAIVIIGIQTLVVKLRGIKPLAVVSIIIVTYFASTSGLLNQLLFNVSNVNLNNYGSTYDAVYLKDGEIDSLDWLATNAQNSYPINLDTYSALDADAYTTISDSRYVETLLPTGITNSGYVYESASNKNRDMAFQSINGIVIRYNPPNAQLNNLKNTIYVNSQSVIYK